MTSFCRCSSTSNVPLSSSIQVGVVTPSDSSYNLVHDAIGASNTGWRCRRDHYVFESLRIYLPIAAFVGLRGIDRSTTRSAGWLTSASILGLVAVGYYLVYATSPLILQYHLDSSLNRLLIQLWPSVLLVLGLLCRTPRLPE